MSSVWVQLYYKGEEKPVGEAIEIDPIPMNVYALKMKVKENYSNKLKHTDAGILKVYASGTDFPVEDGPEGLAALPNNMSGSKAVTGASYERPLIVIAPKPEQQNGKLRCYSRIHSCIQFAARVRKYFHSCLCCFQKDITVPNSLFTFSPPLRYTVT
jgi:hypothetical protein